MAGSAAAGTPDVDASGITVENRDGDVVLSGRVPSYPQYIAAAAVARRVAGVKDVHNRLEVTLPPGDRRDDSSLTATANDALTLGHSVAVTAKAGDERVELRVVDHGTGLPPSHRRRAFLPFQRLGRHGDGTSVGLGLVVSSGLAEAMGGTVEPEETPGGGLTMVVSLPAAPARPPYRRHEREEFLGHQGLPVADCEPARRSRSRI